MRSISSTSQAEPRPLYRHQEDDGNPVWLPNGAGFVFRSEGRNSGLWMQPVRAGKAAGSPRLLAAGFDSEMLNTINPDGSLYFFRNSGRSAVCMVGFDPATGLISGQPKRISDRVPGEVLAPSWSPDGKAVALISVRSMTTQPQSGKLVILRGETMVAHALDFGVARGTGATWSSDGLSLFMPGTDLSSGLERLYCVDAATGRSTVLPIRAVINTKLRVGRSFPVLTRDAKGAFASRGGQLFQVDLSSGEETEVYNWTEREILYSLALSPDGRQLAFGLPSRNSRPRLAIMPANGGTPEVFYPGSELNPALGISWEPDGRHILAVAGENAVRFCLDERHLRATGLKQPGLSLPSLNPGGTQLLYQVSLPKLELWALEHVGALARTPK